MCDFLAVCGRIRGESLQILHGICDNAHFGKAGT
jgi:hypothetical protein